MIDLSPSRSSRIAWLLPGLLLSACWGSHGSADDFSSLDDAAPDTFVPDEAAADRTDESPETDGAAGDDAIAESDGDSASEPCPGFPALATPEEIAATPRADLEMEQLALATGSSFTADSDIYQRLVDDVPRIRTAAPEIADIRFFPPYDRELLLSVDPATGDRMDAGDYLAWDCLNAYYRATGTTVERLSALGFDMALVHFSGIYDLAALAAQYARLPDILGAEPNRFGGDASTICVAIEGSTYHYVFDRAGGDCPEGCTAHVYHYFYTAGPGAEPIRVGTWDDMSGTPPPDWVARFAPCP